MAAVREEYERVGAAVYYRAQGATYRNPHEALVRRAVGELHAEGWLDLAAVLDLACGSGEVTLAVRALGGRAAGCDPYTGAAYRERVGAECEAWSFGDVAGGALEGRAYSLVACSFALHLAEASRLPAVCAALARVAPRLLILTPHKRPVIREVWGWRLAEERTWAVGRLRCRGRVYSRVE